MTTVLATRLALMLLVTIGLVETHAFVNDDPSAGDHRTSGQEEPPPIKLPPLEGPTVQWRLLSLPVNAGRPAGASATRYRLMAIILQLTTNPSDPYQPLQLRPPGAAGMRANIAYHRPRASDSLELNRPFAMYLVDQRAYVIHRRVSRPEDAIVLRVPRESGSVQLPSSLVLYKWDPSRRGVRPPPAEVFQWQFRAAGGQRTGRIETRREQVLGQWLDVTEYVALFNSSANGFLVLDIKRGAAGWRTGQNWSASLPPAVTRH